MVRAAADGRGGQAGGCDATIKIMGQPFHCPQCGLTFVVRPDEGVPPGPAATESGPPVQNSAGIPRETFPRQADQPAADGHLPGGGRDSERRDVLP